MRTIGYVAGIVVLASSAMAALAGLSPLAAAVTGLKGAEFSIAAVASSVISAHFNGIVSAQSVVSAVHSAAPSAPSAPTGLLGSFISALEHTTEHTGAIATTTGSAAFYSDLTAGRIPTAAIVSSISSLEGTIPTALADRPGAIDSNFPRPMPKVAAAAAAAPIKDKVVVAGTISLPTALPSFKARAVLAGTISIPSALPSINLNL